MLYLRAPSLAKQLELSSPLLKPARGLSRCLVLSLQWDSRIWPGLSGTRYGATKACRIQRTPPPPSPSASAILGSRHLSTTRALDRDDRKMSEKVTAATTKLLTTLTSQHENIYTIPNILTFSRLAMAPVIGWAILSSHATLALSLFGYAAVTDLVDGFVARRFKQESVVGTIIDPMADKVLMTVGVVCLSLQSAIPRE
ncbi:hypothetical protein KEM55_006239 [Ascosphaera atra]|nr:hypothetical protein KEM55_006239 [Ascosphaera atra]